MTKNTFAPILATFILVFGMGQNNCETPEDIDGDGYTEDQGDCDDSNPTVNPGASEVCDGVDNNCDGVADEGVSDVYYEDLDGDTFGNNDAWGEFCELPAGYAEINGDCDDQDDNINPAGVEECDGLDNDCDGESDEGVTQFYYTDNDADGFGDSNQEEAGCDLPTGYAPIGGDCDDVIATTYPGAPESCDANDNDCDGAVDEGDACQ